MFYKSTHLTVLSLFALALLVELQAGLTDLLPCNDQCGGDYEDYSFGQTDKDVTIAVPLKSGTAAKQVKVVITTSHLEVTVPEKGTILSGKLFKPIKAEDSTWSVEDRKTLVVTLVKTNLKYEEWWPFVIEGERQIDMKTLRPPEVHMSELDDGAQATVARMMFEQRQKQGISGTSFP